MPDKPLGDTCAQTEYLTGRFVADLVLQILSYAAQKERENIKERRHEGIASAKKRGVQSGRPSVLQPDAFSDIVRRYMEKTISFDEALSLANMKKTTFYLRMSELSAVNTHKIKHKNFYRSGDSRHFPDRKMLLCNWFLTFCYLLNFVSFNQVLPPIGRARPHTRPRSVPLLQHSLFSDSQSISPYGRSLETLTQENSASPSELRQRV